MINDSTPVHGVLLLLISSSMTSLTRSSRSARRFGWSSSATSMRLRRHSIGRDNSKFYSHLVLVEAYGALVSLFVALEKIGMRKMLGEVGTVRTGAISLSWQMTFRERRGQILKVVGPNVHHPHYFLAILLIVF